MLEVCNDRVIKGFCKGRLPNTTHTVKPQDLNVRGGFNVDQIHQVVDTWLQTNCVFSNVLWRIAHFGYNSLHQKTYHLIINRVFSAKIQKKNKNIKFQTKSIHIQKHYVFKIGLDSVLD